MDALIAIPGHMYTLGFCSVGVVHILYELEFFRKCMSKKD